MNKPRPEPFLPAPVDPRRHFNKFHRRLLFTLVDGGSGSALPRGLIRQVLGRKRRHNSRLYTRAHAALLGLECAGYVQIRAGRVLLTLEGWLAAMGNREGCKCDTRA